MKQSLAVFLQLVLTPAVLAQMVDGAPSPIAVQHYEISAEVQPDRSFIEGRVEVRFSVLEDTVGLSFDLDSRLSAFDVKDEKGESYSLSFEEFRSGTIRIRGEEPFRQGQEKTLQFSFDGILEEPNYAFLGQAAAEPASIGRDRAVLLSEGHWFPSHGLPLQAATASVKITVPLGFTAVAPGELKKIETVGVSEVFFWESERPVTSIPVVIERFFRQQLEATPVPVTLYVGRDFDQDVALWEAELSKIFNFFRDHYGPLPIQRLNLVQVGRAKLFSTGCAGLVLLDDGLLGQRALPVMELARRIARQWWGYSVRFKRSMDAWLQDGFATYAALRYIEETHPDRFQTELARLSVQAMKYQDQAATSRGLQLVEGSPQYESIVSSKGAWVLYMFAQLLEEGRLNGLLRKWYEAQAGRTPTTEEWVDFVEAETRENYQWFFVQWVESVGVPELRVEYKIYRLSDGTFRIRGQVEQDLELFRMPVDIRIETKGQPEEKRLNISGKRTSFDFSTETLPLRMDFDPHGKILSDSPRMRVAVHIALGEELQAAGEMVSAIREYEQASKLNPRSSLAYYRLAEVFFEQQNLSSAADNLRDALNGDLQPDWIETWAHIYLGKVYDILGQRQRAMAEYQKALNTRNDYNGAQAEAEKYLKEAYTAPRELIG